jgi:hypothetical protein
VPGGNDDTAEVIGCSDYMVLIAQTSEPDAWKDPAFLRSLGGGVHVTIGEGEQKTQHLRIGRAAISGRDETGRTRPDRRLSASRASGP